jgi:hypothetical protein
MVQPPADGSVFDVWDPANVSPLVAYLATAECAVTGQTFYVQGGTVKLMQPWTMGEGIEQDDRWTVAGLRDALPKIM